MSTPLSAQQTLDREFLELRAQLLSLAASFDRLDRGGGSIQEDPRWIRLQQAVDLLKELEPGRAERLQLLFSLPYREDWRSAHQLK